MPKVSVIIPIYGVEKYIERCARSLFEQTLDDIEYIFINDCTQDRSIDVLTSVIPEYPSREKQILIITMDKNSGQALVRRRGIEIASGDYIIHCDSDDYIHPEMYRIMYEKAVREGHDIVACDVQEISRWPKILPGNTLESKDFLNHIFLNESGFLCNKLVRSSVVHSPSIIYPECNFIEDLVLTSQYAILSHSVGYISEPLYFYVRRDTSITGNHSDEAILDKFHQGVKNLSIILNIIQSKGLIEYYFDAIVWTKLSHRNSLLRIMPKYESTNLWRNTFKEIDKYVLKSKVITKQEKRNFIMTKLGLYPTYIRLKGSLHRWKQFILGQ